LREGKAFHTKDLRGREQKKIECGQVPFDALGVDYKDVMSHNEI
jgi:restriction endonuclease